MNLFQIIVLLFLLAAFSIGIATIDLGHEAIDEAINTASSSIDNISLTYQGESSIPNIDGFFNIIEKGVKFVGALFLETLRAGIYFGQDNPQYFTPDFIIFLIKLIIFAIILALLIKPLGYLVIIIIVGIISLKDYLKRRKINKMQQKEVKSNGI